MKNNHWFDDCLSCSNKPKTTTWFNTDKVWNWKLSTGAKLKTNSCYVR